MLTAERLRELLHYDPETGDFRWVLSRKGAGGIGTLAGGINGRGYRRIGVERRRYMANVLGWLYMTGAMPTVDVDHINGVRSDNRWTNLRAVSRSVNNQNQRRAHKGNKAGLLGVSPNHAHWAASIQVYGKKHHLGTYNTAEEAHVAYLIAKRGLHVGNQL
jgi:hypothetical protein